MNGPMERPEKEPIWGERCLVNDRGSFAVDHKPFHENLRGGNACSEGKERGRDLKS